MATESAYEAPPVSDAEQRNADEITDRRLRLVKALLAATTAFAEAAEQIGHLNGPRVFDIQFEESWRTSQLVKGAGQFLDALIADVDAKIGTHPAPGDAIEDAWMRTERRARDSYLDALANAVPLFSAAALARRPFDQP